MSLPEGLILTYRDSINFEPMIQDAQGMDWVHFPDHDTEDPLHWFADIVFRTCEGLGVTAAINEAGDEVTVPKFVGEWLGLHEGEPGFTT